jgi:hypothetical protein
MRSFLFCLSYGNSLGLLLRRTACTQRSEVFNFHLNIEQGLQKTKTRKKFYHCSFLEKYMIMPSAINRPTLPISKE